MYDLNVFVVSDLSPEYSSRINYGISVIERIRNKMEQCNLYQNQSEADKAEGKPRLLNFIKVYFDI